MFEDLSAAALRECGRLRAAYAEFRAERATANSFSLKNGVLEDSAATQAEGLSVRVVTGGGSGFASTNELTRKAAVAAARKAYALATSAAKFNETPVNFTREAAYLVDYEVGQKKRVEGLSPDDRINYLKALDAAALATKVNLPMRYLSVGDWTTHKFYENTEGTRVRSRIPRLHLFYAIAAVEGAGSQQFMFQFGAS